MLTALETWIPGPPVPQSRPRFGRGGRVYHEPDSAAWREAATIIMRAQRLGDTLADGLYRAYVDVVAPRPQDRPDFIDADTWALGGRCPAGSKGDLDNFVKAALDSAVDAGWLRNDNRIAVIVARKVYAEAHKRPGLWLRIEVMS